MASQKSIAVARSPQRERGKLRVAALLDAGALVFAERGYDAATMTEIAAQAKAAIGSLYQFFPSKEALADALLGRYADRLTAALVALLQRAPGLTEADLADALVDLMIALRADRAIAIALIDARGEHAGNRIRLRDSMRAQIAAVLVASAAVAEARAGTMAIVILHLLKAVPALAEEEEAGQPGLLAEMRSAIRLYISDAKARA